MVSGDHAGVAGVELIEQPHLLELGRDLVDPLRHDQAGTIDEFGQEVPHGPTDRAGHADDLAFLGQDRELPVDLTDALGVSADHSFMSLVVAHVEQGIASGVEQVDDTFNVGVVLHDECHTRGQPRARAGTQSAYAKQGCVGRDGAELLQ